MQDSTYVPPHLRGGKPAYVHDAPHSMESSAPPHRGGFKQLYQSPGSYQNPSFNANGFQNSYQGVNNYNHRNNNYQNSFGSAFQRGPNRGGYQNSNTYGSRFNMVHDDAEVLKLFETTGVSKGINFAGYDNIPVTIYPEGSVQPIQNFSDLALPAALIANLERCKYDSPTPVQKYTVAAALQGTDIMACAQTGSGKTAAFLLPVIAKLLSEDPNSQTPMRGPPGAVFTRCVIMAPTRELTIQIHIEARKFCYQTGMRAAVLYGGADIRSQLQSLNSGGDIVIATPGRLWDVYQRGRVRFASVKHLVLDEADRMLDMGFEPQIRQIVQSRESDMAPKEVRQTMMFSATFPKEIQSLAHEFLARKFIHLTVGRIGSTTQNIIQTLWCVEDDDKMDALVEALRNQQGQVLTLVFAETRRGVEGITRRLVRSGFPAVSIHGDKSQSDREHALNAFRSGQKPILVATDVASRGLDIPNVTCVIQFDLPHHVEEYVHRIGRTGRCGNEGEAIGFYATKNASLAKELHEVLSEAKQEIPAFLQSAVDSLNYQAQQKQWNRQGSRGGPRGGYQRGGFGGSRGGPQGGYVNSYNNTRAPNNMQHHAVHSHAYQNMMVQPAINAQTAPGGSTYPIPAQTYTPNTNRGGSATGYNNAYAYNTNNTYGNTSAHNPFIY